MQRVNPALLPKVEYGHARFTLDAEVADRVRKLQRAVEREWGVYEILLRAVNGYAEALCAEYFPHAA